MATSAPRGTDDAPDLDSTAQARADYELLVAARTDPVAFRAFYDRWSTEICAYFQRRVQDPDVALDLTAETFAVAYERLGRFRWMGKSPGAWLYGISRRLLYRYYRTQRTERGAVERLGLEVPVNDDESYARIDELVDGEGMRRLLQAALASCRDADRLVLELYFLDELPYPDIAATLDCTVNAARVRVHRALRRLEGRLTELEAATGVGAGAARADELGAT